jgi:hypothetical protein
LVSGKSDRNGDYYGFGVPIVASGNSRVAAVHDGEPDSRRFNQADLAVRETAYLDRLTDSFRVVLMDYLMFWPFFNASVDLR